MIMTTNVQNKSNGLKKMLKKFLQLFIRLEMIPFSYDGKIRKYYTLYIFGIEIFSDNYITSKKG